MAEDLAALIAQLARLQLEHEEANQFEFERLQKLIEGNARAIEALAQNHTD
ncbi:MAG: hypothetical protein AB4050_15585 [Synechococcus sp.]